MSTDADTALSITPVMDGGNGESPSAGRGTEPQHDIWWDFDTVLYGLDRTEIRARLSEDREWIGVSRHCTVTEKMLDWIVRSVDGYSTPSEYYVEAGKLNGIPECCVEFWINDWSRRNDNSRNLDGHDPAIVGYVRCMECIRLDCRVKIHDCTGIPCTTCGL